MTRARSLSKLVNPSVFTLDTSNNVGLNSTSPSAKLGVSGIVSATAFYGDGSNLEGVASAGLGTAVSETAPGDVIYYTNNVLSIGDTITVDPPSSTNVSYTQYAEVAVAEDADLIIADGDDFVPDILGLSTEGVTPLSGAGGRIRAGSFVNKAGTGAPQLTLGAEVPVGYGITGAGFINVSGVSTFSGNVTIGGTLTYEDVTNVDSVGVITAQSGVDSVGVITAQSGIKVGAGESISAVSGTIYYYGDGSNLDGVVSGIEVEEAGSSVGTSLTAINFASGATVVGDATAGIATVTISAGLNTAAVNPGVSTVITLNLGDAQDHKVTATGITTITVTGGTEGDSHTVRVVNSGVSTVGFSTYFLFPSGSSPSMPTGNENISLISFTVHQQGSSGIATQLLAGASVNYS